MAGGGGWGRVQVDVMKPKGFILEYPDLTVALYFFYLYTLYKWLNFLSNEMFHKEQKTYL